MTGASYPAFPTMLIGTKSTNQSGGGGGNPISDEIIILETGKVYVFKIENLAGEQIYLYHTQIWFER